MKNKLITCTVISLFVLIFSANAQQVQNKDPLMQIRQYWFVLLTKGPNRSQDSVTAAKIQNGHLANIMRLYKEGKLKVAGPFGEDGDWQGIFIFDSEKKEEVEQWLKTDPAIASGRLNFEIHSWWTAPMGSFVPGKPKTDQ
ncbi:MAG TPA: YciI family protein [Chitinophagaceae bacterium]|jgi:uncharacterized protein YciI|nr:YciI family protein [Chitinophagaceae bacterium]